MTYREILYKVVSIHTYLDISVHPRMSQCNLGYLNTTSWTSQYVQKQNIVMMFGFEPMISKTLQGSLYHCTTSASEKNESQYCISISKIKLLIDVTCWLMSDVRSRSHRTGPASHDVTSPGLHFNLNLPEDLTQRGTAWGSL
jgi:hypothetical protein